MAAGIDAERHADGDGENHPHRREKGGDRKTSGDLLPDGTLARQRQAEITLDRVAQPEDILLRQAAVEAEAFAQLDARLLAGQRPEHGVGIVSGQAPSRGKDEEGGAQEDDDRAEKASRQPAQDAHRYFAPVSRKSVT